MLHVLPELERENQPTSHLVLQNEVFILSDRHIVVIEYAEIKNEVIEKFRGMRSEKRRLRLETG